MQSYDNHSFPTPPCLLLREQQAHNPVYHCPGVPSGDVPSDWADVFLPVTGLLYAPGVGILLRECGLVFDDEKAAAALQLCSESFALGILLHKAELHCLAFIFIVCPLALKTALRDAISANFITWKSFSEQSKLTPSTTIDVLPKLEKMPQEASTLQKAAVLSAR